MKKALMSILLAGAFSTASAATHDDASATEASFALSADCMEKAAAPAAWTAWCNAHPAPFRLFGEDRRYAVRNNIVPAHWIAKDNHASECFNGVAQPGEFYPFQVCVASDTARKLRWNANTDLKVSCITPRECEVGANGVKPIWVMLDIPKDATGKTFKGTVVVEDVKSRWSASIPFKIEVKGAVLADGGVGDAWRLARLKWLNSDIGREETVTKPYEPVVVDVAARTVKILGRELVLGEDGLPKQIVSHFSGSNTHLVEKGFNLLAQPFTFTAEGIGEPIAHSFAFTDVKPTYARWRTETRFGATTRIVEGRLDFTGSGSFRVRHVGANVARAALEVRIPVDVARFMEGLGRTGGTFSEGRITRTWDATFHHDAVWMGRINGGLAVRFKGANYRRPLINAYYAWRKLVLPESWASGGGEITVEKSSAGAVLRAEGADAPVGAEWNFDIFLTPFHRLDMKAHLGDRYLHLKQKKSTFDARKTREMGATVVNLHHNTVWNPYINYPYNDDGGPFLKKAVSAAHDAGLLLKIYYTTRELTQNLPEFFALKSLDGEVLLTRDASVPGWPCTNKNGPHPWLREHVGMDILPAWRENVSFAAYSNRLDLAVITTPDTRWDNFYLAGLDYLVREYGIDGLYIDDTALTDVSMQRARRILDRDGRRRLVDNHSGNHHSPRAGGSSSNIVFLDLYPYFDLLWRGEGFFNDTPADFWLMERSGIAFGLTGEMLGRGNPFRGMLYGMTDRWGWGGNPHGLWKFFDDVGLGDMELVGWWDDECPVSVIGSAEVKASVWKGRGKAVLVVANFSKKPQSAKLAFDAKKLGFDGATVDWTLPAIEGVQKSVAAPDVGKPIKVPGSGGYILVGKATAVVPTDAPALVLKGRTLADVQANEISGNAIGMHMRSRNMIGFNKVMLPAADGQPSRLRVEMQMMDSYYLKCIVLELTDGAGGVHGRAVAARYVLTKDHGLGWKFVNADGSLNGTAHTLVTDLKKAGYGIEGLTLARLSTFDLSFNFFHADNFGKTGLTCFATSPGRPVVGPYRW